MQEDSYAKILDQLYGAVSLLASGRDSLEERLAEVYFSYLQPIDASVLPDDARAQFNWIREQLQQMFPQRGQVGRVQPAIAVVIAQNIILLQYSLRWRQP